MNPKLIRANKDHTCSDCEKPIHKGKHYYYRHPYKYCDKCFQYIQKNQREINNTVNALFAADNSITTIKSMYYSKNKNF